MKRNNDWLDDIQSRKDFRGSYAGQVKESDVKAFEKEYGIILPADYRAFLMRFGCGSIGSIEILGLGVPPVGIPSLPWFLNDLKSHGMSPPIDILPVSPLGDGTYAAVLCKPKGAFCIGTVVRWTPNTSSDIQLEVLGSTFSSYLMKDRNLSYVG